MRDITTHFVPVKQTDQQRLLLYHHTTGYSMYRTEDTQLKWGEETIDRNDDDDDDEYCGGVEEEHAHSRREKSAEIKLTGKLPTRRLLSLAMIMIPDLAAS